MAEAAARQGVAAARLPGPPRATYRVQLHSGFTFADARRILPYLSDLGISHLYTSPYLRARTGSMHGYDVADPSTLNPELGTEEDYAALVAELRRLGMGQLVDVVPNHMGVGDPSNYRWLDVLENGRSSRYAPFFDINWAPLKASVGDQGRVVVPVLGDQYGVVLERGEIQVAYEDGAFRARYYDHVFPLAPDTYPLILLPCLAALRSADPADPARLDALERLIAGFRRLPSRKSTDPAVRTRRAAAAARLKQRLGALAADWPAFQAALERQLAEINGTPGVPASFDALDELLSRQSYRLAFWRVAAEEINYRRFFDINELAAVRMEDPRVFEDLHRLLMRLVGSGAVDGLRIDHPDGLRDPEGYFARLQQSCRRAVGLPSDAPDQFYVVVEKILTDGEQLPADWPVSGTTGYDFLSQLNGLFVDRDGEGAFNRLYHAFSGVHDSFPDVANASKKMVMLISLASEVNELAYQLKQIASWDRRHRDFTLNALTFAVREVIAALRVYRTYLQPQADTIRPEDADVILAAAREAQRRNPRTDPSLFFFISMVLLDPPARLPEGPERAAREQFIARFQQTTGPVMAKGVEDTAFYVYNRLVSLNDVGGNPDRFGVAVRTFHQHNQRIAREWPHTLLATSTHDTKRSEDVRARINLLSEMPRAWRAALTRWSRTNARKRTTVNGAPAPDRNDEYLLYQILLGAWPLAMEGPAERTAFQDRIAGYMVKALREGKAHTSWIAVNAPYEEAVVGFARAILAADEPNPFLDDFLPFCERLTQLGLFNALSQTALKLASPGVPDIYQGCEIWDFSLVDPDNRRPVDFDLRQRLLQSVCDGARLKGSQRTAFAAELLARRVDGRVKLWVAHNLLALRAEQPGAFGGAYRALQAGGAHARHVCAFERRAPSGERVLVVAPVLLGGLLRGEPKAPVGEDVWGDTFLTLRNRDGGPLRNVLTGEAVMPRPHGGDSATLRLADALASFPVAAFRAGRD